MTFVRSTVQIGYHPECKWHFKQCDHEHECTHHDVDVCFNGDFFRSEMVVAKQPSTWREKLNLAKSVQIYSAVGVTEDEAVANLIDRLKREDVAA